MCVAQSICQWDDRQDTEHRVCLGENISL